METQNEKTEKLLYQYFLKIAINNRKEALELLKERKFNLLNRNYIHWIERKEKEMILTSCLLPEVIKFLSKVKLLKNESDPILSILSKESEYVFNSDDLEIILRSYIYKVIPYSKCKIQAKFYTKEALWRLKHQPNSLQAKALLKVLN